MGGLPRARAYSKKQMREWGHRGGRPRNLDRRDIRRLRGQLRRGEAKAIVGKRFGISSCAGAASPADWGTKVGRA
jgi:hypothetical protein